MGEQLSVLIKTYNEEAKLKACLLSVFSALKEWGGNAEVIVADSNSTDGTLDVARAFPVGFVRLSPNEPRGCGIGVELGYRHARHDYILLIDGDMELQCGFLPLAFGALAESPRLAGVAGTVVDKIIRNGFDRDRRLKLTGSILGEQRWLAGGGLYRRSAIDDSGGYAGDRNLLAYEEAELGLRLRCRGWRLLRLSVPYVLHTGHALTTLGQVHRIWSSGRIDSGGVLLRGAIGRPWLPDVLSMLIHPIAIVGLWCGALVSIGAGFSGAGALLLVSPLLAAVLLAFRRRSLSNALLSVALWHLSALGLIRGLLVARADPAGRIDSSVLADAPDVPSNVAPTSTQEAL